MSKEDWAWLCRPHELLANLYIICIETRRPLVPTKQDPIPWPLLLLLGSYSREHCFLKTKQIKTETWRGPLADFVNKWPWHFINEEQNKEIFKADRPLVKRATRAYTETATAEINWY